jgi:hypothetical protein
MLFFSLDIPPEWLGNEGARSEYPWMNTTTLRYTSSLFVRRERDKQDLRDRRDARR